MLVNMQTCADRLGVSRQTLHIWVRKFPDFPIESRGTNGQQYQFDIARVLNFLAEKKEAEARELADRDEALSQLVLPMLAELEQPQSGPMSVKDQLQAIQLSSARRKEQELLKQLVPTAQLEQAMTIVGTALDRNLRAAVRRAGLECNLPPEVTRKVDDLVKEAQQNFARDVDVELQAAGIV